MTISFGSTLLPMPLPFRGILGTRACEEEARLLDSTVGRVVPLLPLASACAESELDASVERLFDEDGSADQGDSATGGGRKTKTEIVAGVRIVSKENVAAENPKRLRKKRQAVTDASGSSYPPKKQKSDHGTSSGAVNAGKSPSALKELLASSILNVESGIEIVATLPFVTSSVSATPEHESSVPADFVIGPNLRTISVSKRFVISSYSSHHSSTNASRAEGDSIIRSAAVPPVMTDAVITTHAASISSALAPEPSTKVVTSVHASMFHDSDSTRTVRRDVAGSSHVPGKELLMGSQEVDSESLHDVKMWTEYCLSKRRRLESEFEKQAGLLKAKDAEVEDFTAQLLLKEAEAAEAIHLRAKVSKFKVMEKSLWDETSALKERNTIFEKERNALDAKVTDLEASVLGKECELTDLNSLVASLKSQNDILTDLVHELEISSFGLQEKVIVYENCMEQLERSQDDRMKVVNDKWLLAQGMELAIVKCLNSLEYLSVLGAAISKAIEKGMQDGLSAGITYSKEGRVLIDVAVHNPSTKTDYISTLQKLQNVNFSLLAELMSNKDASVETVMNILRLEEPLAKKLGLNELQPTVDQLMVPIHYSANKVVIGTTALSLALDVSSIQVQKIRENIANQRSSLHDVFVSLAEPFSTVALTGTEGTSGIVSAASNTTTALSTTLASAGTVPSISIEDYEVMGTDGADDTQGSGQGEVSSFPNTVEFEKEELDTTPDRDPPS
nr:hypothetical protein [Tanacetum cinerariifolium]